MKVLLLGAALLAVQSAFAAELIPYQLPAQPRVEASVPRAAVSASAARVPDSTYQRFEQQVRGLKKADDLATLAQNLGRSRDAAATKGDVARELYYTRLLEIIRKVQGERR